MQSKNKQREVMLENNKIESLSLFEQYTELTIIHNEQEYKLRLTKNDKLILTK
ncbi:MAG: hemin uptake protein HemP [Methylophagaceae bacterium]|jgi:hemin uptake protein HemP